MACIEGRPRPRASRRAAAALAVTMATLVAACSSGSSGGSTDSSEATTTTVATGAKVAPIGTYAVGSHTETWVDPSRTTMKNKDAPELPQRTLPVFILYPAQGKGSSTSDRKDAEPADGRFPVIVWSHGVTSQGIEYRLSMRVLASAGYVVVAPTYPLSNRHTPGGAIVIDMPNQAKGDIPFLLDQILAANAGKPTKQAGGTKAEPAPNVLKGLVDPDRIGIGGHSLGAVTSLAAGYDPCCADARVKAVAEWSGILVPLTRPFTVAKGAGHRPLLIVHGTSDATVPYASADGVWKRLGSPKVEVSLPGQGHVPAFVVGEGSKPGKVVVDTTVAFFDATLKDDPTGFHRIDEIVTKAGKGVATIREDLG